MGLIADLVVKLGADISNFESGIKKSQDSMKSFDQNVTGTIKNMNTFENNATSAGNSAKAFGTHLDGVTGKTGSLKGGLEGIGTGAHAAVEGVMKIAAALGLVAIAAKAFDAIKTAVSGAFERMDTMAQFSRVITVMTGNADDAKKALGDLNGIVKGTAYGLDVAAKATQDFVTRGMSIEAATGSVRAWADAVAFYGKGTSEEFANVSDALSKMRTKGTVEMDQLNRLFDSGIDAVGIYAKATGQMSTDVQDALSKGEISSNDFLNVVENAMMTGANGVINVSGAAQKAGESWKGTFDNMASASKRGMEAIILSIDGLLTSNGLPSIKQILSDIGSGFENMAKSAAASLAGLQPIFDAFASGYAPKSQEVQDKTNEMTSAWGLFFAEFDKDTGGIANSTFWKFIGDQCAQTAIDFATMSADIAEKGALLMAFFTFCKDFTKVQFDQIVGFFQWGADNWAEAVRRMQGDIDNIQRGFNDFMGNVNWVWNQIVGFFQWGADNWAEARRRMQGDIDSIVAGWYAMCASIEGFGQWLNQIQQNMVNWTNWAAEQIRNALNGAGDWWQQQFTNVMDWFAGLGDRLSGYGKSAIDGFWSGINNAKEELMGNIGGFVDAVVQKFYDLFDSKSDSKKMVNLGYYVSHGLITGMKKPDVMGFIDNMVKKMTSKFGNISAVGGDLSGWIQQAMTITGQSGLGDFQHLLQLAMNESGGNPNAINLWDSNAMAGIPSMGLMQTIQPTFDAYSLGGSIWDPVANAVAAIRYMLDRYGSIQNTPLGGYALGTNYVPQTGIYMLHEGESVKTKAENAKSQNEGQSPLQVQLFLQNGAKIAEYIINDIDYLLGQKNALALRR